MSKRCMVVQVTCSGGQPDLLVHVVSHHSSHTCPVAFSCSPAACAACSRVAYAL